MIFTLVSRCLNRAKRSLEHSIAEKDPIESQRIPFEYIADRLCKAARFSRDVIGKRIIAPNIYCIRFAPEDRALRKHFEHIIIEELKEVLAKEIGKWSGVVEQKWHISIETDSALSKGNFYIDCHYSAPEKTKAPVKPPIFYSSKRKDLSRTSIPPSSAPEMLSGSMIRTVLNADRLEQESRESESVMCSVKVLDRTGERSYYVPAGSYLMGRGKDADMKLYAKDVRISRKHLEIKVEKAGMTLKMIGRNGGKMNDEFIESGVECFVNSGDSISVGETLITVRLETLKDCHNDNN